MQSDPRLHSAAAERNRGPIVDELRRLLPATGLMLEIASGTGQHAAHAAAALPLWRWQPSEADTGALASIRAWCKGLPNVLPPLVLDVLDVLQDVLQDVLPCAPAPEWPGAPAPVDAIFNANLIHIAPWPVCAALMQGAACHLAAKGQLVLYGPYIVDGEPTAPGNLAFDADLRNRNAAWGLRRLADVQAQAQANGLQLQERVAMPANNLLLVFVRGPGG